MFILEKCGRVSSGMEILEERIANEMELPGGGSIWNQSI